MSDFEDRLRDTLGGGAADAPTPHDLTIGARRRLRDRRRKYTAAGVVGVALAIAVPVAIAGYAGGDERVAGDPTPAGGWKTIEQQGVQLEVPSDWVASGCKENDSPQHGIVANDGTCTDGGWVVLYEAEEEEEDGEIVRFGEEGAVIWSGYVEAGDWGTAAWTDDRALTRRILASVRLDGQPRVEADVWEEVSAAGVSFSAPARWGVGAADNAGYGVEVDTELSREDRLLESEQVDDAHYRFRGDLQDRLVTITAPTRAVADLVWATVDFEDEASLDLAPDLPCDPGMGEPEDRASCPHAYSTGELSLTGDDEIVMDPVGGSSYVFDLAAVPLCSGVIRVDYREPLEDHSVDCNEFRRTLEANSHPIRVVVWQDGRGDVVQLSELYHP